MENAEDSSAFRFPPFAKRRLMVEDVSKVHHRFCIRIDRFERNVECNRWPMHISWINFWKTQDEHFPNRKIRERKTTSALIFTWHEPQSANVRDDDQCVPRRIRSKFHIPTDTWSAENRKKRIPDDTWLSALSDDFSKALVAMNLPLFVVETAHSLRP